MLIQQPVAGPAFLRYALACFSLTSQRTLAENSPPVGGGIAAGQPGFERNARARLRRKHALCSQGGAGFLFSRHPAKIVTSLTLSRF